MFLHINTVPIKSPFSIQFSENRQNAQVDIEVKIN